MIKKTNFFIVIVIFLLVFCVGCGRFSSAPTDETLSVWNMDFHKGTKGLSLRLVENQPPSEVWENSAFQVGVELKNGGVSTITDGRLYVSGFKYLFINENDRPGMIKTLEGKSQFNPEGGFDIISFPAQAGEVIEDDKTDSFVITACYKYKTTAGLEICINPRVLDLAKIKEGDCKPSSVSSSGQGAPVVVTKVEENFIPVKTTDPVKLADANRKDIPDVKVLFKIHISNSGGGKVVKSEAFTSECSKGYALSVENESNVVYVKDVKFSTYSLATGSKDFKINCSGFMDAKNTSIKISSNGEAVLSCSTILKDSNSYTTPLIIELEYGYTEYVTKSITIKNIAGT